MFDNLKIEIDEFFIAFDKLNQENEKLKKENALLKMAIVPEERAILSYVNKNGCVRLPDFIIRHLKLQNGGGVIFDTDGEFCKMLTDEQVFALIGED